MWRRFLIWAVSACCVTGTASAQSPVANTVRIYNSSGFLQTNRPVSISRAFRQGEILTYAQASVDGSPVLTQCDAKNRWPDGSLKFAVVSFVIPSLPVGSSALVSFSEQPTGNNTGALTQSQMLDPSYAFDAIIEMAGGTLQSVSARQMLANGQFRYWLQGPIVTAVIIEDRSTARSYDRDFGDGSKALHPIFEAWFYSQNHDVDVGYTVENTWASSDPARSMRDLSYSLTLKAGYPSPTVRFTHTLFNHIGRSRWHKRFHTGQAPGDVRIDHNLPYLVTTRAIPNYDTSQPISESLIASMYSTWNTRDRTLDGGSVGVASYSKALGQAGANMWIGLMNTWEVVYLRSMDDRMFEMTFENADLAGRIPWHFREADPLAGTGDYFDRPGTGSVETFGRVVSINARKTVGFLDLGSDCGAATLDDKINTGPITDDGWSAYNVGRSHMPDVAYVAYLLSGRYYYLEELQYLASYILGIYIGCNGTNYLRQADAGYIIDEVRGDAWGFRTVAYAAFLSPDGTPERPYFEDKLMNNVAMWEGQHSLPITDPSRQAHWNWGRTNRQEPQGVSPLGAWKNRPGVISPLKTDGSLLGGAAPWEENFLVCALGMARQFGYSTETLLNFMARHRFNLLLNPATLPYFIESYLYPTMVAATNNWVQTWAEYGTYYATVPTGWKLGEDVDHSYGFIAMAAVGFLADQSIDGYTGQQAWSYIKANKPGQDRFVTESPKWDILPLSVTPPPPDTVPPAPPAALRTR